MKRVAIIQARTGSTRLPSKVLADLAGKPMLVQQLRRVKKCKNLDEICIATTGAAGDDPIVELARGAGVAWFRGDEDDVLSRYLGAARETRAEVVVRITADCPLIDAEVVDRVVATATAGECDYVSNTVRRSWPRGLDTEVLFRDVLERVGRLATSKPAHEHVTWFVHRERPELFLIKQVYQERDDSDLRWTVDTPDDMALARAIYEKSGVAERWVPYEELVGLVRGDERLITMNAHVRQKEI